MAGPRSFPPALAWAPAVGWAALIFALSSRPVPPLPPAAAGIPFLDKIEHFVEYGVFGLLLVFALRRGPRLAPSMPPALEPVVAAVVATLYAFSDEVHQSFVPLRQADPADLLVDAVGALVCALVAARYLVADRRVATKAAADPAAAPPTEGGPPP